MQCPNCFTNIPEGSSVCPICKKSLSPQGGSQNSSLYPNWQPTPQPQPQDQTTRVAILERENQKLMQCPHCFSNIPVGSSVCPACGKSPSPQIVVPPGAAILEGKKRTLMIWSIISLLFVCVPVGIYGLVKHSSISKIANPAEAVNAADRTTKVVIIWTVVLFVLSFILGFLIGLI